MRQHAPALGHGNRQNVVDLMMPGMDGFELARKIKSDPGLAAIHLVMLTSFGERGNGAAAREAGVAAYLTMVAVVDALHEMERMGRENRLDNAAVLLADISREFA